jgi:transaldolase / glucose-6-phosphate isomerase
MRAENIDQKPEKKSNPLQQLAEYGQSFWLDSIQRKFTRSGELKRLVEEDGLRGETSNPAIFQKAIGEGSDYDSAIRELLEKEDLDPKSIYEHLAIQDIQEAADVLLPVFKSTHGRDGFVSLEVSPELALKTEATIEEARRLWKAVNRPNVMIKVPATLQGVPAFRQLIGEGINVNVTLLFSVDRYEQIADAYIEGLEKFAERGGDLSKISSVASFFVSRIDTAVDDVLAERIGAEKDPTKRAHLSILMGKIAISNAKLAYKCYEHIFSSSRWKKVALRGGKSQRVLWASTGTKNPAYKDTLYVEELIGKDTVNTMPSKTLAAFRDHGELSNSVNHDVGEAQEMLDDLEAAGISLDKITECLLTEGIREFVVPFQKLLGSIAKKRIQFLGGDKIGTKKGLVETSLKLSPSDLSVFQEGCSDWDMSLNSQKLWDRDPSLWTNQDEGKWLGWLDIIDRQFSGVDELQEFSKEVQARKFEQIVLLGMGGSSLCPEVLALTFAKELKTKFRILDSTDPTQIRNLRESIAIDRTLFIVSSKSGTTLEPNIYEEYFYNELKAVISDPKDLGSRFIAITDPGSKLEAVAKRLEFWKVFHGDSSIGGRYSALSDFGIVPAAAMGIDVVEFLKSARRMELSCSKGAPSDSNPGVQLGVFLGTLARSGRDKVTLICSKDVDGLGAWLEQLLAESTGKVGKGLIPVSEEPLGDPSLYGEDRVFAYIKGPGPSDQTPEALDALETKVKALEEAGQPVARFVIPRLIDLGQIFFQWEIATAVAGSLIGIDAFNQPDVEASKIETRKLTEQFEKKGELPPEKPIFEEGSIQIFADAKNENELFEIDAGKNTLASLLHAHLSRFKKGDYVAFLPYLTRDEENQEAVRQIREHVHVVLKAPTCLGFGPRFLHSTGQAYKGGPNTGIFFQLTQEDSTDLPVPGHKYSFGVVKAAQARGDLAVLYERGRRAIRIHLGRNVSGDLHKLSQAMDSALETLTSEK